MKRAAKFAFGLLSLVMGTAILIWCGYCLFVPNEYFRWHLIDIPRLAVPVGMIWLGWSWIRGSPAKGVRYSSELTITLKLSDSDFGTQPERDSTLDLKHRLEAKLAEAKLGEIDGEEFGGGECCMFVHTNAPAQAKKVICGFFSSKASSLSFHLTGTQL
jgi:hypothetical protein